MGSLCGPGPKGTVVLLHSPSLWVHLHSLRQRMHACATDRKIEDSEPASIALMSQINCLRDTMLVLRRIVRHKAFQTLACACGHRSVPLAKLKAIDLQVRLSPYQSHFSFSSAPCDLLQDLNKVDRTSFWNAWSCETRA
jgi:hypothetical protein